MWWVNSYLLFLFDCNLGKHFYFFYNMDRKKNRNRINAPTKSSEFSSVVKKIKMIKTESRKPNLNAYN